MISPSRPAANFSASASSAERSGRRRRARGRWEHGRRPAEWSVEAGAERRARPPRPRSWACRPWDRPATAGRRYRQRPRRRRGRRPTRPGLGVSVSRRRSAVASTRRVSDRSLAALMVASSSAISSPKDVVTGSGVALGDRSRWGGLGKPSKYSAAPARGEGAVNDPWPRPRADSFAACRTRRPRMRSTRSAGPLRRRSRWHGSGSGSEPSRSPARRSARSGSTVADGRSRSRWRGSPAGATSRSASTPSPSATTEPAARGDGDRDRGRRRRRDRLRRRAGRSRRDRRGPRCRTSRSRLAAVVAGAWVTSQAALSAGASRPSSSGR